MRRSSWRFKDIIIWLFIFVIGSLIVSFIIYPSSFYSVKDRISEKVNFIDDLVSSSSVEIVAPYQICISGEFNRVICKSTCSFEGMDYRNYKCVNGGLICKCKK